LGALVGVPLTTLLIGRLLYDEDRGADSVLGVWSGSTTLGLGFNLTIAGSLVVELELCT